MILVVELMDTQKLGEIADAPEFTEYMGVDVDATKNTGVLHTVQFAVDSDSQYMVDENMPDAGNILVWIDMENSFIEQVFVNGLLTVVIHSLAIALARPRN